MNKIRFSAFLFILALVANVSVAQKVKVLPDSTSSKVFSLMTYNIRHGKGMDNNVNLARIANEIALVAPDVVALQEVDYKTQRSGGEDTPAKISELTKLGYKSVFGKAILFEGGEYGNAILSLEAPMAVAVIPLMGKEEPRCLLVAEFKDYFVANCHLSLDEESRVNSCYSISSIIKEISDGKFKQDGKKIFSGKDKPIFLCGDFNATPESTDIFVLMKSFVWLSKSESFTFPSDKPDRILDYIFLYKNKSGIKLMKEFEKKSKGMASWVQPEDIASDHRPVNLVIVTSDKFLVQDILEEE